LTAGPDLTRDAQLVIARHVDSVGVLDLLLLLRGDPDRVWTRDAVRAELACPSGWAERELERLRRAGLAEAGEGGYRYAPSTARERAAIDSVARAWRRDRAAVTRLIFEPRRSHTQVDA
jgi:hypothetical protein